MTTTLNSGRPPTPQQRSLNLKLSARTVLVDLQSVRAARGVDAESVLAMVDNALHDDPLRFVFDFNSGVLAADRKIRELRFWVREVIAPETCAGLTIHDAIASILGERNVFRRGEIEVQWVLSAPHIMRLVRAGEINEAGNRLLRASLESFLLARWEGRRLR